MKHIILILITLALIGTGCTLTTEEKAQKGIKDYLQRTLDDPKSYESNEFGLLLMDSTDFKETPLGNKLNDTLIIAEFNYKADSIGIEDCKTNDCSKELINHYKKSIKISKQRYFTAKAAYDREITGFKSEFKGYIMKHTFRAKNGFGAYVKESAYFYLDKDFQVYKVF
jgi:hypothetical protein